MKAVILAGGYGCRMGDITEKMPKPMVRIGGTPILLHIINYFRRSGVNEFIVCGGYKIEHIREYFQKCSKQGGVQVHGDTVVEFGGCKLIIADTGQDTGTAKRLVNVKRHVLNEPFFLTYGDGLSDVDLNDLYRTHQAGRNLLTLTVVHPRDRFGIVEFDSDGKVLAFQEKMTRNDTWINGGFMVVSEKVFEHILPSDDSLEKDCFPRLAKSGVLGAYPHDGFWQCMDTVDERKYLEVLFAAGHAPWAV